jgi:hypothetical protein
MIKLMDFILIEGGRHRATSWALITKTSPVEK